MVDRDTEIARKVYSSREPSQLPVKSLRLFDLRGCPTYQEIKEDISEFVRTGKMEETSNVSCHLESGCRTCTAAKEQVYAELKAQTTPSAT